MHGGAAPQVKQAAADRLKALIDPAITTLEALLSADNEHVRLGAAKDVLDRGGFKPVDRVDLTAQVNFNDWTDAELDARIAALQGAARTTTRIARRANPKALSD